MRAAGLPSGFTQRTAVCSTFPTAFDAVRLVGKSRAEKPRGDMHAVRRVRPAPDAEHCRKQHQSLRDLCPQANSRSGLRTVVTFQVRKLEAVVADVLRCQLQFIEALPGGRPG